VVLVELPQRVERLAPGGPRHALGIREEEHRVALGAELDPLVLAPTAAPPKRTAQALL
jgi:hypothetical protein